MNSTGRMRAGTRWTALSVTTWMAAYALVLQMLLVGAAVAALPRVATTPEICFGAHNLVSPASGQDETAHPGVHCPACLARADLLFLPPPMGGVLSFRLGETVAYELIPPASALLAAVRRPGQPRAPPALT